MELKATALVARCVNYKESDKMLTLITREYGRVDAAARGSRKTSSRLLACTQQFCYGEFVLYKKGERFSVRQGDIIDSFYGLRDDYEKLCAGAGMLACIEKLSLPGEPDEALFMWGLYFLTALCHSDAQPLDLSLCFIVKLMAHAGYRPMLTRCALCNKSVSKDVLLLDAAAGGLVCKGCASHQAIRIHALTAEALERMLLVAPDHLSNVRLPAYVREELSQFLPEYAEQKMERALSAFRMLFKPYIS